MHNHIYQLFVLEELQFESLVSKVVFVLDLE